MGRRPSLRLTILIMFAILYVLRRPADALYPYVWAEDGLLNIPQAIQAGWSSVFIPVNGYLIVPSKLVTLTTLSISGLFYPEVSYLLTFLATLAVLAILTSAYVALPTIIYLPLIIALLPYNPEVFATPLYIFWWTSLLLLVPLLAPAAGNTTKLREQAGQIALVVLGGLSSPLAIVLWPMMMLRTILTRARQDYLLLGVWTGIALLQLSVSFLSTSGADHLALNKAINTGALPTFIGNFLVYDGWLAQDNLLTYLLFAGLAGAAIYLITTSIRTRKLELFYQAFPLVGLFGSIMAALVRLGYPPDPMEAGPRYFFFPFIFLALFLLATATYTRQSWVRYSCIGLLIAACSLTWINDFSKFFRLHEPLDWRGELQTCVQSSTPVPVKVHSDGRLDHLWYMPLLPQECQILANSGGFARIFGLDSRLLDKF